MAPLSLLATLLLALSSANACTTITPTPTVVQTITSIIAPSTTKPTITPTPSYSITSSSSCNWLGCGSSSCIPSTTSLLKYICDNTCLNSSTVTSTTTTYPPPVTVTIPCNVKFARREEEDLEKRWTCAPGPTISSTTSLACSDCHQFPTVATATYTWGNTYYTSNCQYTSSSSTKPPTPTSTSTKSTSKSSSTKKTLILD